MTREEAFRLLGVDTFASRDVIRSAFRELAAELHPDRGGAPRSFAKLRQAYELLLNEGAIEPRSGRAFVDTNWIPGAPPPPPKPSPVKQGDNPVFRPGVGMILVGVYGLVFNLIFGFGGHDEVGMLMAGLCGYVILGGISMVRRKLRLFAVSAALVAALPIPPVVCCGGMPVGIWAFCKLVDDLLRVE